MNFPTVPGLQVYALPQQGRLYVIGADPAEGNPTSDDSAMTCLDLETGEEACKLAGKVEPSLFASYIDSVGRWYNGAMVLVERQNHGHAVLLWLGLNSPLFRLPGLDGKEGWNSSQLGKIRLYDAAAEALRNKETAIHSLDVFLQLSSIEGGSLRAPDGERDDLADAYALALQARLIVYGSLAAAD